MKYSIFAFAHQDDEFGVYAQIERCTKNGDNVYCIYFTDGALVSPAKIRNSESTKILTKLGVKTEQVLFVGDQLSVKDGRLYEKALDCTNWLYQFIKSLKGAVTIFSPSWEGGHHDHDIVNAIVTQCVRLLGPNVHAYFFPLYRRAIVPYLFRVMSPIRSNEDYQTYHIPLRCRIKYVLFCTQYYSQWRTWLIIFPGVAYNYLLKGRQFLKPLTLPVGLCKPHAGKLLYEMRGHYTWYKMEVTLSRIESFDGTETAKIE